jgi:hypothetical protein
MQTEAQRNLEHGAACERPPLGFPRHGWDLVEQRRQMSDVVTVSTASKTASEMPCPSVRTLCLLPGRARSTGQGLLGPRRAARA